MGDYLHTNFHPLLEDALMKKNLSYFDDLLKEIRVQANDMKKNSFTARI